MKLLLTSAGWEEAPVIGKEFLKLVNKKPSEIRILLVMTPLKYPRKNIYIKRLFRRLKVVDIPERNITFFKLDKKANKDNLKDVDAIFVLGGNTFDYLDRIRKTGLDKLIKNFVKNGGVYLGLSAGSYVACPTIEAASWKYADENEIGLKNLKGLNLVPFLITAHFDQKSRPIIEEAAKNTKYKVISLTDKQAILVKGRSTKIIGRGKKNIFNSNKKSIIKILKATPDDVLGIAEVKRVTWLATYPNKKAGITVNDLKQSTFIDLEKIRRRQKEIKENKNRRMWVAKDGKRVVGFCGAMKENGVYEIGAIYLLPDYQGRGIGKILINRAFEWLGITDDIKVSVVSYNKQAINFYKSVGFKKVGNVKKSEWHKLACGKLLPEIEMEKRRSNG